jgi:hypothetical protein
MDEAPADTFDAEDDTMPLLLRFDDDCLQSEVIHSTFFYSVFIMDTKSRMVKFALATEPCGTSCPYEARIPDFPRYSVESVARLQVEGVCVENVELGGSSAALTKGDRIVRKPQAQETVSDAS